MTSTSGQPMTDVDASRPQMSSTKSVLCENAIKHFRIIHKYACHSTHTSPALDVFKRFDQLVCNKICGIMQDLFVADSIAAGQVTPKTSKVLAQGPVKKRPASIMHGASHNAQRRLF